MSAQHAYFCYIMSCHVMSHHIPSHPILTLFYPVASCRTIQSIVRHIMYYVAYAVKLVLSVIQH